MQVQEQGNQINNYSTKTKNCKTGHNKEHTEAENLNTHQIIRKMGNTKEDSCNKSGNETGEVKADTKHRKHKTIKITHTLLMQTEFLGLG